MHVPGALEREQPPRDRARVSRRHRVVDRRRRLELDHTVVARHLVLPAAARRSGEHREDPPAHATGAHPRKVEMTVRPALCDQRVIVGGEDVVVPVEHGRHGCHSGTVKGRSTAGRPSMLVEFFSRW
jgi:hypothetical protein